MLIGSCLQHQACALTCQRLAGLPWAQLCAVGCLASCSSSGEKGPRASCSVSHLPLPKFSCVLVCGWAVCCFVHNVDLLLRQSHWQGENSVAGNICLVLVLCLNFFNHGWYLYFCTIRMFFLQYLSCQFITNKMQGFYFYWKHYYSYVFTV